MTWESVLLPSTPLWELLLRGSVMYLAVFALMRIVGRREPGELNTTDLILVVIISEAAAPGLNGEASAIADSVIVVGTVLLWSVALDAASYLWRPVAKILKPRPRSLVRDGDINPRTSRREFMTREEVLSQLRLHGITDLSEVHRAVIEPNGMISIVTREEAESESAEHEGAEK